MKKILLALSLSGFFASALAAETIGSKSTFEALKKPFESSAFCKMIKCKYSATGSASGNTEETVMLYDVGDAPILGGQAAFRKSKSGEIYIGLLAFEGQAVGGHYLFSSLAKNGDVMMKNFVKVFSDTPVGVSWSAKCLAPLLDEGILPPTIWFKTSKYTVICEGQVGRPYESLDGMYVSVVMNKDVKRTYGNVR